MSAHQSLVRIVVGSVSAADQDLVTLSATGVYQKSRKINGCETADTANEKSFSWVNVKNNVTRVPLGSHYFPKPLFLHSIKAFYLL